jgi:hypothetical protein
MLNDINGSPDDGLVEEGTRLAARSSVVSAACRQDNHYLCNA